MKICYFNYVDFDYDLMGTRLVLLVEYHLVERARRVGVLHRRSDGSLCLRVEIHVACTSYNHRNGDVKLFREAENQSHTKIKREHTHTCAPYARQR